MEARYTSARLRALPETRALAGDFDEAHDKLALLEEEGAELDLRRMETQAKVEIADDAWDDAMHAFQRRLLELAGHDVDAELYRSYFADIPSQVTSLSYSAEIMISKELESKLALDEHVDLAAFASRLEDRRKALEGALHERTRLEVDEARFANRVAMAKAILNKLRRVLFASLDEIARARGLGHGWCFRFFHDHNPQVEAADLDGAEAPRSLPAHAAADPEDGDDVRG
jgi:hypothetical protein